MKRFEEWHAAGEEDHSDYFELSQLWSLLIRSPAHLRAVQFMFKFRALVEEYEDLHKYLPEFHPGGFLDFESQLWDDIGVSYLAYEIQDLIETLPEVPPLVVDDTVDFPLPDRSKK